MHQIVARARPGDRVSRAYDVFIVAVAFVSIIPLMFRPGDVPAQVLHVLSAVDVVTVYILAFDYLLRWMTHDIRTGERSWRAFVKYPFTPAAILDLLSILPSLGVLPESFKFLRALRITKVLRYSKHMTLVANVFRAERRTLLSVLIVALVYIFICALFIFVNEPSTFDNFLDALYWSTITVTSVGYGDVYPTTDVGKVLSMVSAIVGVAIIALPAGIVTGSFLHEVRKSQADAKAYYPQFNRTPRHRGPRLRDGVRAVVRAHPKVVAYAVGMAACFAIDQALYQAVVHLGAPLWLDTVGTALAAILLEPAAGLIVGFANNLVLAIQFWNAGNLLYYCLSAITALAFGVLLRRGARITVRSLALLFAFVVLLEPVISAALSFTLAEGQLTTVAEQRYGALLTAAGLPWPAAAYGALLVDKLLDTLAVLVIVLIVRRAVVGRACDPQVWYAKRTASACAEADAPEPSASSRPAVAQPSAMPSSSSASSVASEPSVLSHPAAAQLPAIVPAASPEPHSGQPRSVVVPAGWRARRGARARATLRTANRRP